MKNFAFLLIIGLLLTCGCTIEKRKYTSGYHTTWNFKKTLPQKTTAKIHSPERQNLSDVTVQVEKEESIDLKGDSKDLSYSIQSKNTLSTIKSNVSIHPSLISNADTVPETKIDNVTSIQPIEKYDQEKKDIKRVLISWLTLVTSFLAFVFGIAIIIESDAGIGYALLGLGVIGAGISIILIIAYTIIKNRHLRQSHIYYNQNANQTPQANPNVPRDPEEIASKVKNLNKKIKSYNIFRFSILPISILTITYLFPFGLASLILFFIYTSKRKRLIAERNNLLNNEPKTNPFSEISTQDKASLQEQLAKLNKKMKINKIFMALSCLTIIIMATEASTAALSAIPAVVLALLISIVIQIIWAIQKTNVRDELNLIH